MMNNILANILAKPTPAPIPTTATEIDSFFQGIFDWCGSTVPLLVAFLFGFLVADSFGRPIMIGLFGQKAEMVSKIGMLTISGILLYALVSVAQGA